MTQHLAFEAARRSARRRRSAGSLGCPCFVGHVDDNRWAGCSASSSRRYPRSHELDAFYREQAPDVVLITPLVDLGSPQIDHYMSARALGLRTVLCVGSWDHLSSKSVLRAIPDLVTVWNDTQKREAYRAAPCSVRTDRRDGRAVLRPVVRMAAIAIA